ncbi:MAG: hypothetical protein ACLFUB_01370 [Cyclobacteriaceae bacterium]
MNTQEKQPQTVEERIAELEQWKKEVMEMERFNHKVSAYLKTIRLQKDTKD